jgi:predicted enzyme related to lactoylglutathione lyase
MGERTEYLPGTPSWVDIGTDVEPAKAFYTGLFGWSAMDAGPPEETGGYGFFMKDGKLVAGYGPQQNPGPPAWSTYVSVADADAIVGKVQAAGGTVVVPPMDVMTAGRMAVFQDQQGAFFSVWQPGEHKGAQLVNDPGSFSWNELNTRDLEGSKRFYSAVFGWEPVTHGEGQGAYTEWQLGGTSIGGMMEMPPMVPAQVPPHWLVYFSVDDTDATIARVEELGGKVMVGPMDVEPGRLAVVTDPQGGAFAVIRVNQPGT